MTRKSTSALRQQLATQEANDDALATKIQGILSWYDKMERQRVERDEALKSAIDEDRAALFAENRVAKADLASMLAELRGSPVQFDGGEVKQLQAAE